ncbi:MAG: RNA-binding S4 domain-containing protein [Alphaproteobacteria bacterium]
MTDHATQPAGLRLDKWLFYARFFKSRGLAAKILAAGKCKVNGSPVAKAHVKAKPGDVLTFPKGNHVRMIKVLGIPDRRGPYTEAVTFYEDLDPPTAENALPKLPGHKAAPPPRRAEGSGRPTKKDRRAIRRFEGDD